jgi:acetyl/propionyl-CoA carboxylase alpha subunit
MFYDPLIAKLVLHGGSRYNVFAAAALEQVSIDGVKTNIPALMRAVCDDRFRSGEYDTSLLGA